jgi:hypothetical protein
VLLAARGRPPEKGVGSPFSATKFSMWEALWPNKTPRPVA